jgi:isoamylase
MTSAEWTQSFAHGLGAHLSGRGLSERDAWGQPIEDDDVLLLLNAHHDAVPFRLPADGDGPKWTAVVDTAYDDGNPAEALFEAGGEYPLQGRSLALLTRPRSA